MKSLDDYEVISVIGSGSFGTCFKVQDKITNKIYAWKAINYDEFEETKKEILDSEIGFLQQLKHPNIVQYYDHICNIETQTIFIIMEYCDGGDVQNLIKKCHREKLKFEEKYIWKVLYQISKALQLCHNKISEGCILHRDIKPANIFLDKCGNVKLGDFGLARIIKRNQQNFAESIVGSPYYMSPEIVHGRKYDKKSDMWAVGCLIYEMCCLKPPFRGNRFEQLSENISSGQFDSIPSYYSKDLQEIISFMLEVDSEQRPNVKILLRHPVFIRNLNNLKADFPKLLPRNDLDNSTGNNSSSQLNAKKLLFSSTSSLNLTNFTIHELTNNENDFNEGMADESCGRITGISTPELRAELFGSPIYFKRKNFPRTSSVPDLNLTAIHNERIYANSIMTSNFGFRSSRDQNRCDDPELLTRDIFENALKTRLETIRAQEMLLNHREYCLMEKEKELMEREVRLTALEKDLDEKKHHVEGMLKRVALEKRSSVKRYPKRRISNSFEESYCTIEPNESMIAPTVAKLEMSLMPPPSAFLRCNSKKSVTFVSPKKIFKPSNDSMVPVTAPPQPPHIKTLQQITEKICPKSKENHFIDNKSSLNSNLQSSKASTESENSNGKISSKRRSILSIFGIKNKSNGKENKNLVGKESVISSKSITEDKLNQPYNLEGRDKVNSKEISQIWTKENKRAAFQMLAAMTAADKDTDFKSSYGVNSQRNSNIRKTTRDRGTSLNRCSKLRRSAIYLSPNTSGNRIIL